MINILLTGAGFTKNFGAPLAKNIYEAFFNHKSVQQNNDIRKLFIEEDNITGSNYENIYQKIIDDKKIKSQYKPQFKNILFKIFLERVDYYCRKPQWGKKDMDYYGEFFLNFINSEKKCIFFSLNQDLFVERQFAYLFDDYPDRQTLKKDSYRLLKKLGISFGNLKLETGQFQNSWRIKVTRENFESAKQDYENWKKSNAPFCFYIKLHGSIDFKDENNIPLIITGEKKESQILDNDLLNYYNEIFAQILCEDKCRLLIIGYGFNDKHINKKLINGSLKHKHEIFIVDEKPLKDFYKELPEKIEFDFEKRSLIMDNLKGYLSTGMRCPEFDVVQNSFYNFKH